MALVAVAASGCKAGIDDLIGSPRSPAADSSDSAEPMGTAPEGVRHAGGAQLAERGIDWCGPQKVELAGRVLTATTSWHQKGFSRSRLVAIAHQGCSKRLRDDVRQQVLAAHGKLVRWARLPASELRLYMRALTEPDDRDPILAACRGLRRPRSAGEAGLAVLLGCDGWRTLTFEDDTSSALGSAGATAACIDADSFQFDLSGFYPEAKLALCGAEARALDRAAIDRELRALAVKPPVRAAVKIALRQIDSFVETVEAKVARDARDPMIAALYKKVPDEALRAGRALARKHREDLAAVRAYRRAAATNDRRAVAGCFDKLHARLGAHLVEAKPKTVKEIAAVLKQPATNPIARASQSCAARTGHAGFALALYRPLSRSPDYGGPRARVYWAVRDHLDAIAKSGLRVPIDTEVLAKVRPASPKVELHRPGVNEPGEFTARIKTLARGGGAVQLTFESYKKKVDEGTCHDTNKVHKVDSNGRVIYMRSCNTKMVTRRFTPPPVAVRDELAAGLARGYTALIRCDASKSCFPIAVWKDKAKTEMVSALGVKL